MFCRYCGNELPEDAKFCNSCGAAADAAQNEQPASPPGPAEAEDTTIPSPTPDRETQPVRRSSSKQIVLVVLLGALVLGLLGIFGLRAVNEASMKQQVPQNIYENSTERVIAHYDKTMAYPYGNNLGYDYSCDFTTFEFTKGDKSNTFNVDGEMEVTDKFQEDRPSYRIVVHGTATTNFFRSEWSADWTLFFQDPIYEALSYSETSTPAMQINRFRDQFTSYNGAYIEPHIPSESGGYAEGSGHVEVTVNLEAAGENKMNANITVWSFSDSARIAEVSIDSEMEISPEITFEFDEDGWGNKGVLHLLFLKNGGIGVWSEITEYSDYANWELAIGYMELAKTDSSDPSSWDNLPEEEYYDGNNYAAYVDQYAHKEIYVNHKHPVGYFERYTKDGYSGGLEIVGSEDENYMTFNFYLDPGQTGYYGNSWVEPDFSITTHWLKNFSSHIYAIKLNENTYLNIGLYGTFALVTVDNYYRDDDILLESATTDYSATIMSNDEIAGTYYCVYQEEYVGE